MKGTLGYWAQAVRHNGVLIDRNSDFIRRVAEGVTMLDEKLERFRGEVEARFRVGP